MALNGDVRDFPLAELLFFLSSKQRTGKLTLTRPDMTIIFLLRFGRLIAAQMIPADQRLGERLLSDDAIEPVLLHEALQIQQEDEPNRPLGTLLVERGYVEREIVVRALREQIADCLFAFLIAPGGTFAFHEKMIDPTRVDVDVVVERAVLEAIRRADEHVAHQIDTGPLRLNPHVNADILEPFIFDNWDLIDAMLEGAQTVDEIMAATEWERSKVLNTLVQLQASGAIDLEFALTSRIGAVA